jgi:thioesterase domain-containing protein
MQRYCPRPYPGRLTLFRARTSGLFQHVVRDRGWRALAETVDIDVVKGNHLSILREPAVRRLAEAIEARVHGLAIAAPPDADQILRRAAAPFGYDRQP